MCHIVSCFAPTNDILLSSGTGNGTLPDYVLEKVVDNRRRLLTTARVLFSLDQAPHKSRLMKNSLPKQRNSALFTATNDAQDTYDAYEKDIAIASFFFEEPTAYEYSR